ncbi:MAG TPA: ATP-binding protein [Chloroflexota bacterium]
MRAWWRARGLRFRLATTIAAVGLFLIVVNAALLSLFLERYVVNREGTTLAQQAAALSRCAPSGVAGQLLAGGPAAQAEVLAVLRTTRERHAVVVDSGGSVLYASPMPAPLRDVLVSRLRQDLRRRRLPARGIPPWQEMRGELAVDIVIACRLSPAPTASNASVNGAGGLLLAEDSAVPAREWHDLVTLVILVGLAATGLGVLAALVAGEGMARSVRAAASAARAVARGNFQRRIAPNGPAEIAEMVVAFNTMVEEVLRQRRIERDLLANISHELASPLSLIRGYAEALADRVIEGDDEQSAALCAIRDESARLQRLTEDLLDLALLESGQVSMHVDDVPVGELLLGLRERMAPLAQRAGVTLSVDASPDLSPLPVDVQRLEQVLINLLNNALRHTPPDGTITMAARRKGAGLELTVADTGAGIPAEELPRIWERFYRVEKDRDRREPGGLGLGLAICRSTIAAMHGTIEVDSTLGVGTTFRIWLPLDRAGTSRASAL